MGCVYKSTNIINNKVYIGKTIRTLEQRKYQHEHSSKKPKYRFSRAIKKYGKDNFKWEVVFTSSCDAELFIKESKYIKQYNSTNTDIGYNMETGSIRFVKDVIEEYRDYLKVLLKYKKEIEILKINKFRYDLSDGVVDLFISSLQTKIPNTINNVSKKILELSEKNMDEVYCG